MFIKLIIGSIITGITGIIGYYFIKETNKETIEEINEREKIAKKYNINYIMKLSKKHILGRILTNKSFWGNFEPVINGYKVKELLLLHTKLSVTMINTIVNTFHIDHIKSKMNSSLYNTLISNPEIKYEMILKISRNNEDFESNNINKIIDILLSHHLKYQNTFLIDPIIITAKGKAKDFIKVLKYDSILSIESKYNIK
jgi:hypothetical protein